MINKNGMFVGEIRDIADKYASGRYKVRIYGHHNDTQNIKDEDLPIGQFLHHAGSAATSKIGMLPTGPIVGTRVFGFFMDEAKQIPVILGSFPRGAKLSNQDADVGEDGLDSNSYGVDSPLLGGSKKGLVPNAPGLGGTAVNPVNADYNRAPFVDNDTGNSGANTARSQNAPNADKPTIAGVDPSTALPDALQKVGSDAQVLPNMMKMLSSVQQMMNFNTSAGTNLNQNQSPSTVSLSGVNSILSRALTDVLSELSDDLGCDSIIQTLTNTFSLNNIENLDPLYEASVNQAVLNYILNISTANSYSNLSYFSIPAATILSNVSISNTLIYFSNTVSVYSTPKVNVIDINSANIPSPIVFNPPDYYSQEFFYSGNDKNPCFVQWIAPNNDVVYTVRTSDQPNYISASDSILGQTEIFLYDNLYEYFRNKNLTVDVLNDIVNSTHLNVQVAATESTLGNNSSSNKNQSLTMILGIIGSMINQANTQHLPNSVLNQGSMSNVLQLFANNIGTLQQMKTKSNSAFNPSSLLNSLSGSQASNLGGISSIISSFSSQSSQGSSSLTYSNLQYISNNVSTNTLNTIANVTLKLENKNVPINIITDVQTLLSEIIID